MTWQFLKPRLLTVAQHIDRCFTALSSGTFTVSLPQLLDVRGAANIPFDAHDPLRLTRTQSGSRFDIVLCNAANALRVPADVVGNYFCQGIFCRRTPQTQWYAAFVHDKHHFAPSTTIERDLPTDLPLDVDAHTVLGLQMALFREQVGAHHPFSQVWGAVVMSMGSNPLASDEARHALRILNRARGTV